MWWWWLGCPAGETTADVRTTSEDPPVTVAPPVPTSVPSPTESSPTGTSPTGSSSVLQFDGPAPTHLLLVSLDTTRRDRVGRFAGSASTPNLDAVLAEGVSLDDHRSCSSWTGPSMTCITTGLTPFDLGWFPWNGDPNVPNLDPNLPTLAQQLQVQNGFTTWLITANSVMGPALGLDRGFVQVTTGGTADHITDLALEQAEELLAAGNPYYLHVHYLDPHLPYCPPDEYVDEATYEPFEDDICTSFYEIANSYPWDDPEWEASFLGNTNVLYDGEIAFWDAEFGRLWDGLDAMGALDDTLVVFATDHGEQIFERGDWGHGKSLFAEENRAVAGFWARNLVGGAWAEPTVHEDIGTTLIDFFGLVPPQEPTGVVVGTAAPDRPLRAMLYWNGGGSAQLSITQQNLQLTYTFWGEKHLWDYALDPTGTVDYYDPADPDVKALWGPMQDYIDEILKQWPSAGPALQVGP